MLSKIVSLLALLCLVGPASAEPSRYGAALDVGVPDGALASVTYWAHSQLLVMGGLGHNSNSVGVRAGLHYLPFDAKLAPYLALDLGHDLQARTPGWMREAAQSAGLDDKSLDSVGYQFVNAHVGARLGSRAFAMTVQFGPSFVRANTLIIKPKPNYTPPVDLYRETTVDIWMLSGQVGVRLCF